MPQISNSKDIYQNLVEESEEDWLLGLLAFAIIEEQRIEWMQHHSNNVGAEPTTEEISNWYRQQPDGVFLRAKGDAQNVLAAFCSEVTDEAVQAEREKMFESAVLDEVRSLRKFWPQFSINVLSGIVSAIVFAAILVVIALFLLNDISPTNILRDQVSQEESK